MQYKTIVLELLRQRPQMHDRLRKERSLLATLEHHAQQLKASHESWTEILRRARPDSDLSQSAAEALELAIKELEAGLPTASLPDDPETH